jgi:hypothetical protein
MSPFLKGLLFACTFSFLGGVSSSHAGPTGFVAGHLNIVSAEGVELADGNERAIAPKEFAKYQLIVLGADGKEITRVTADSEGNYRMALPPGDYVMDVQGRARGHVRAKPKRFTVVSNQTTRVDLNIDTGNRQSYHDPSRDTQSDFMKRLA